MGEGKGEMGDGRWELGDPTYPTLRAPLLGGDLTGELGEKSPPGRGDRTNGSIGVGHWELGVGSWGKGKGEREKVSTDNLILFILKSCKS